MPVLGMVTLNMKFGDLDIEFDALVSRRVSEVMLGIDFMQKQDVQWRFGNGVVTIQDKQFLLTTRESVASCRRLVAVCDARIPPRSEVNIAARFRTAENSEKHRRIGLQSRWN